MDADYRRRTGRIFDIQKYSIHDGPGIRTIVFLKGCALRCQWCCNPESQSHEIETMTVGGKAKVIGRDVSAEEVMEEVLRDWPYFRRSEGGLTLSGGESLLQPEFAGALLRIAKESGVTTALESTAFADFAVIEREILPWLDLFLMDVKHVDSAKHRRFTSQGNERMLENARRIAAAGQALIIRVPVVPTFNDTPAEIAAIARFASSLPGVTRLHLLPYHRLGQDKYERLGRRYLLPDLLPPPQDRMELLAETARAAGLTVQIGG